MLKLILLVVVFLMAIYCGVKVNTYFSERKKFFQEFEKFLEYLKIQVAFQKSKISQLVEEYRLQDVDKNFDVLLCDYLEYLEHLNYDKIFEINSSVLKPAERSAIARTFMTIGRFNSAGEVANLHTALQEAKSYLSDALSNHNKYGPVSIKLSITLGALVVIILL